MNRMHARLLVIPGALLIVLLLLVPILQIVMPTLIHTNLYIDFLTNKYNQGVILRTLLISIITTVITVILGIPLSLWISRQPQFRKQLLLLVILFPTLTNAVVRNFAWIIILGKNGVLNVFLQNLHLIKAPLSILYTDTAIILGSVYLFLPIMVTTLAGSASSLDIEIEEAAAVLGANTWHILFRIIIPQLKIGILTGAILVFAGTMTAYTTPQLLGGNQHLMMSTLIYQQAMTLGDWNQASVVAIILIVLALIIIGGLQLIVKKLERSQKHA